MKKTVLMMVFINIININILGHNLEAYGIFIDEIRKEDGKCDLHNIPIAINIPLYASLSVYLMTQK